MHSTTAHSHEYKIGRFGSGEIIHGTECPVTPEELRAITGAPWLGASANELAQVLLEMAEVRRVGAGETVSRKFSVDEYCYGVASGVVKLTSVTSGGRELVFDIAEPGDWFGAMPLIDDGLHAYEAATCSASTLLIIRKGRMLDALHQSTQLALAFARLYGTKASLMQERLSDALLLTLEQRLIVQLLSLSSRFGVRCDVGIRIDFKLTQQDLAGLLGSSRQRINEALKRLERLNLIKLEPVGLVLLDFSQLEARCSK